jgi:hypothetical protein
MMPGVIAPRSTSVPPNRKVEDVLADAGIVSVQPPHS